MNMSTVKEFLTGLFTTDTGAIDWLTLIAAVIAAAYSVVIICLPFVIWRLRREAIQTRKLLRALLDATKTNEHVLCAIADMHEDSRNCLRRLSRAADKRPTPPAREE